MSFLVEFIKEKEGFRSAPYLDAVGIPTIAFGTTYYPDGTRVAMTDVSVSKEEGEVLLRHTLNKFQDYVIMYGHDNGYDWNSNQVEALTSFCHNLGRNRLKQLTNKGTRSNEEIAKKILLYKRAGGKVLKGLEVRRKEEAEHFNS